MRDMGLEHAQRSDRQALSDQDSVIIYAAEHAVHDDEQSTEKTRLSIRHSGAHVV